MAFKHVNRDVTSVTVYDGKYTVEWGNGVPLRALRYGEPWRDCTGDGLILALAQEIDELRSRPHLIQKKDFVSAAGLHLKWKIECDALTDDDWDGIAAASIDALPKFGRLFGVPRGGIKLARAFSKYVSNETDRALVVDDVWTTGKSMREFVASEGLDGVWSGFVAFARGKLPINVSCFAMLNTTETR